MGRTEGEDTPTGPSSLVTLEVSSRVTLSVVSRRGPFVPSSYMVRPNHRQTRIGIHGRWPKFQFSTSGYILDGYLNVSRNLRFCFLGWIVSDIIVGFPFPTLTFSFFLFWYYDIPFFFFPFLG